MSKRKPIPPKLRFKILARDNFTCQYCGAKAKDSELVIDHINPVAKGGENLHWNLITSCPKCNQGKGSDTSMCKLEKAEVSRSDVYDEVCKNFYTEIPYPFFVQLYEMLLTHYKHPNDVLSVFTQAPSLRALWDVADACVIEECENA